MKKTTLKSLQPQSKTLFKFKNSATKNKFFETTTTTMNTDTTTATTTTVSTV